MQARKRERAREREK